MIHITAGDMHFKALNDLIRDTTDDTVVIDHCLGQRYIGSGLSHKKLVINGTPGNALGAYLDGASIVVQGNAQDATGDTMNDGVICIHGSAGGRHRLCHAGRHHFGGRQHRLPGRNPHEGL